ncbi:hypothetical protein L2Y96_19230 [Luteibacter aegosomaticola]|uniref:hypothetical protein n=1 Tax=Luteibacter aegosomaticola TaxID=2911538 RepID=UPI001FF87F2B|nr:hypothetical protein [Luteibacter aegosomaticola]UPG89506.1 hypothetical protein L2Y96_19230 [Luteibacter aegosomaticola]
MLLPREQSPWNCGYYLGAVALQALGDVADGKLDLLGLQERMSLLTKRAISPTQAIAAAAWLYLIDAVKLDENGEIQKCV